MFSMFMVSTSAREKLSVEIHYGGQILCQVYEDEVIGGMRIDFSCDKYVGVPDVEMIFPVDAFKRVLDEAVAALQ